MVEARELFEIEEGGAQPLEAPALAEPPKNGLLVTNHLNLMYMLAAGLVMPPSGFREKCYRDTLAAYDGWLPLFIGHGRKAARAPREAIDESTSEADYLRPVLVEIDLAGLNGPVHIRGEGGWASRSLEEGTARGEWLLCVPAPLPTARIQSILFRSADDRRETEADAAERRNVPLKDFTCKSVKSRFRGLRELPWPPSDGPESRHAAVAPAQAAGGVLGVLHRLANAGDLSVRACHSAFDPSSVPPADSILGALPTWIQAGAAQTGGQAGTGRDLFWAAVQQLVQHRRAPEGSTPEDVLVSFFKESSQEEGMDAEVRTRAADLVSTLEALGGGLGGGTVSEMLDDHQTPLARAAILFLLRRRTRELLDLVEHYPQLGERDRLAAAILFGVRDGWLGMPTDLRGSPELGKAVTHRMAALAHRLDESGLDLGEAPALVLPLRELFRDPDHWNASTEKAAVRLARGMKWGCIRTTVSLGRGDYQFRIESGSAHIDFEGEPKVVTRVDRDRFFERLARERIDLRVEQAVRKALPG